MVDAESFLQGVGERSEQAFKGQKRILSYRQYMDAFIRDPVKLGRNAAQYLLGCFDHYGRAEDDGLAGPIERFNLFDAPFDNGHDRLVGHEQTQNVLYEHLKRFAATGQANRLLLLHGPNGSGKSSLINLIFRALEDYSTLDEGILFRFNWIFTERAEGKGHIGFGKSDLPKDTLAFIDENLISCKIPCELRESPIFLIPHAERNKLLDQIINANPGNALLGERLNGDYLREGCLSAKSKKVFDALLKANKGDWLKVVRHVQVERYFISKRYRTGAAVIMPQQSVDARSRSMTFDQSAVLPPVLQGQQLHNLSGEMVDACGGVVELSDLLKRPLEMNKYLLNTIEEQTVSLPGGIAELNTVMVGTCNEKYLSAFKANPDFTSFKGRIELLRVGYLLEWKKEREVYREFISEICREKHVAPHTLDAAAIWAVMTRLRKPDPANYDDELAGVVRRLTPLEKARLYGEKKLPDGLKTSWKRWLLASVAEMTEEHGETVSEFEDFICAAYEGRRGASAREMKALLAEAAESPHRECLSPLAVFDSIRGLVRDRSVYDFLRLDPDEAYHDPDGFVDEVTKEYFRWALVEIYDTMELIEETEFERRVNDYFRHVRAYVAGEKMENPRAGSYDDPSAEVMEGLEKLIDTSKEKADTFRKNLITKIAAHSLEHPEEELVYAEIFPELITQLRNSYYKEKQKPLVALGKNILVYGTEDDGLIPDAERAKVEKTLLNMREKYGYCDSCAKEAIAFVLSQM